MLFGKSLPQAIEDRQSLERFVKELPLRNLAHLGDAVFELHERERALSGPLGQEDAQ